MSSKVLKLEHVHKTIVKCCILYLLPLLFLLLRIHVSLEKIIELKLKHEVEAKSRQSVYLWSLRKMAAIFWPIAKQSHHKVTMATLKCKLSQYHFVIKGEVGNEPRRPIRPALISGYCSMKRLGVFLLPPG